MSNAEILESISDKTISSTQTKQGKLQIKERSYQLSITRLSLTNKEDKLLIDEIHNALKKHPNYPAK